MDLAVPIRAGQRSGPEPLVWALRSYVAHWPPLDRVFIIGHLPKQIDPKKVIHIPTDQTSTKWVNIGRAVEAVLDSGISEDFLWVNDDMFAIKDRAEFPELTCREANYTETVADWNLQSGSVEHRAYVIGMKAQLEILLEWGHKDPICADLHTPIPLNLTRMKEILGRAWAEFPEFERGHFRGLYGAGLEAQRVPDVKVKVHNREPDPEWEYLSTNPVAWNVGMAGRGIRKRYWRPSKYEQ